MSSSTFDARQLAIGWLSVALASGADPKTPELNRTIAIEHFDEGVRLIATDRYLLLYAFVPDVDHKPDDEPVLEIGPGRIAIARDLDRRGQSMLAYMFALANAMDNDDDYLDDLPQVVLSLDVVEEDETEPVFAGLEAKYVVIDYPGHERVRLDTYDGSYPSWRTVTHGFKPVTTKAIALNTDFLARLGKLGKLHGGPLLWQFGGADKLALLEVADSNPRTRGVVMPVRWNFDNAAAAE
jgi:hypothetical protein